MKEQETKAEVIWRLPEYDRIRLTVEPTKEGAWWFKTMFGEKQGNDFALGGDELTALVKWWLSKNPRLLAGLAGAEIERLQKQNAELVEGLRRFLRFDVADDLPNDYPVGLADITVGDVRRAKALVEKEV